MVGPRSDAASATAADISDTLAHWPDDTRVQKSSSCFDGRYVTESISESYLNKLANVRNSSRGADAIGATAMHQLDVLEVPSKRKRD